MQLLTRFISAAVCTLLLSLPLAFASDKEINLLPKYGSLPKSEQAQEADRRFIANIDEHFNGDRGKASREIAMKGWEYLRSGDLSSAMRRFNQAWLLDAKNPQALWGMAAVVGGQGEVDQALALFREAEAIDGNNIDLAVDGTRMMSYAAVHRKEPALMSEAMARFERISQQAPNHPVNWQNWAIALYFVGDYAASWEKIARMEALGPFSLKDTRFIDALAAKMPRPATASK